MMKVENLLQDLRECFEDAKTVPLSGGKKLVDVEVVKEILDDIEDTLPQEVKQAKAIVADRQKIMADAKAEAENIIRSAEEKKKSLVTQNEIVRQANAEANEIILDAKKKSRDMREAVNHYVEDMLKNAEEMLSGQADALKRTIQNIEESRKNHSGENNNPNMPVVQRPTTPDSQD